MKTTLAGFSISSSSQRRGCRPAATAAAGVVADAHRLDVHNGLLLSALWDRFRTLGWRVDAAGFYSGINFVVHGALTRRIQN